MHDGVPGRARGHKSQPTVIGDVGAACRTRIIEVYLCQDGAEDGCGPRRAITIEIDDTPLVANVRGTCRARVVEHQRGWLRAGNSNAAINIDGGVSGRAAIAK